MTMGNPLSCVIANIFMRKLENFVKETKQYVLKFWARYFDDNEPRIFSNSKFLYIII